MPLRVLLLTGACMFQEVFNKFVSPEDVISFSESDIVSKCHVYNPMFDYVPPELVTFYVTNTYVHANEYQTCNSYMSPLINKLIYFAIVYVSTLSVIFF